MKATKNIDRDEMINQSITTKQTSHSMVANYCVEK
jgi:hypothetical protein